jgi:hypothetical protein
VQPTAQPSATYHLPVAPTKLPRTIDTDPRHAEKLSAHPLNGPALGLFAARPEGWPQRIPDSVSVLALGQDGRMRLIDTAHILSSGDGYDPAPVLPGSLSPSGTKAAFPQLDGNLLVVDLTGKSQQRYFLGHETVMSLWWVGDERIMASTEVATHVVELQPGGTTGGVPVADALAPRQPTARSDLVAFAAAPGGASGTELRRYNADGRLLDRELSTHGFPHWYGQGFTDGTLAVRTSMGTKVDPDGGNGSSIVAVPLRGGTPETIDCPARSGRQQKASCVILGWPQRDRLSVLDHETGQVLSVDLRTEKVSAAARLTLDAQVALRPGVY